MKIKNINNKLKSSAIVLVLGISLAAGITFANTVWQGTGWINTGAVIDASKIKANFDYLHSRISGISDGASSHWFKSGTNLYYNAGNVGIGTASPGAKLHIDENTGFGLLVQGGSVGNYLARFQRDVGGATIVDITGSGNDAQISFQTTGNTFALGTDGTSFKISDNNSLGTNDRFTIDNTGNVGIGTTTPNRILHVAGDANINNLRIGNVGHGINWPGISNTALGNVSGQYALIQNPSGLTLINAAAGQRIGFRIANVDRMTVASTGNVGIGDTTPDSRLDVEGGDIRISTAGRGLFFPDGTRQTTAAAGTSLHGWSFYNDILRDDGENVIKTSDEWLRLNQNRQFSSGVYTPGLFRADGGFQVDGIGVISNDAWLEGDRIRQNTIDGSEIQNASIASIDIADGTITTADTNSIIDDAVNKRHTRNRDWALAASDGSPINSVFVNSVGRVGIGTTTPTVRLDVVGHIGASGHVRASSFLYRSDIKLKTEIIPIKNSLERILGIQGVSFNWKDGGEATIGLIAQDVEKVFPEIVVTEKQSGYKSVSYGKLVAPLIEAIREQQNQIEELRNEIRKIKHHKIKD